MAAWERINGVVYGVIGLHLFVYFATVSCVVRRVRHHLSRISLHLHCTALSKHACAATRSRSPCSLQTITCALAPFRWHQSVASPAPGQLVPLAISSRSERSPLCLNADHPVAELLGAGHGPPAGAVEHGRRQPGVPHRGGRLRPRQASVFFVKTIHPDGSQ